MKKRSLALLLSALMVFSLAGCDGKKNEESKSKETEKEELDDMDVVFSYEDASEYITIPEDYVGIPVYGSTEVTDQEVQEQINLARYANMKPKEIKEGTVKEGDTVHIVSEGTLDGETEPFETQEYDIKIGSGEFIPGYEEKLIGVEAGKETTFSIAFPENYENSEFQGKKAAFRVLVEYIHGESVMSDWTDEFVQEITNGDLKNTADYEAALRKQLQLEKDKEAYYTQQTDIISYLVENSTVHKYPEGLVEQQYDNYLEDYRKDNEENYGYENFEDYVREVVGYDTLEELYDYVQECAEKTATELLVYRQIAFQENITLTKVEYDNYLQTFASSEGYTTREVFEQDFMEIYGKQDEDYLYKMFLNKKVLEDFLQAKAELTGGQPVNP